MEQNSSQNKFKTILIVFLVSGVLFLSNYVTAGESIRNSVSYIYNPFTVPSYEAGLNSAHYFKLFSRVTLINNENEKLEAELTKLKSQQKAQALLVEENIQLKKLKVLDYAELKFKMVNMFVDDKNPEQGYITLGKKDGINKGAIVQYGAAYVGVVKDVSDSSALVQLPNSSANSVKVTIIKSFNFESKSQVEIDKYVKSAFKSDGVAMGKKDEIVVENIKSGAGVANGDVVIINDERVGRYLILGTVKEINDDPALASVNAKISQIVNYENLNTYFIEIK